MNPLFERLMRKATLLTRGGSLQEATRAIQRALSGGATPSAADRPTTAPAANDDTLVVEVEARVVERAPAPDPAPQPAPQPAPAREGGAEQWSDALFAHQHRPIAYKLFVPAKGAGSPRPLVLMLHGCTQNPEDFAAGTQMNQLAREHGFLVLYPAQTQHANSSKCWNWFKPGDQSRDGGEPAIIAGLVRELSLTYGLDRERVYVAGLSAGGAMAVILGRAYPDLFAAVGVHSGLPYRIAHDVPSAFAAMQRRTLSSRQGPSAASDSASPTTVPTIVFHGDRDSTVHPGNGEQVASELLRTSAMGSAGGSGATVESRKGNVAGGRHYTQTISRDVDGRVLGEHWLVHGGGHAWSGGDSRGSFTDPEGPDATAEVLRFFRAHARRSP